MRTSISGSRAVNEDSRGISQREPNDCTTVTCTTRRPGPHALGRERDRAQVPRDLAVPRAAGVRERETAAVPLRERDAQMRFEHPQLLAHRRGRHRELLGRRAHRAQSRDGVEGTHGI